MTTFILIRHAETEGNFQQVWQGSTDAPLTARGRRQVTATAGHLVDLQRECPVEACYVSPLPRAKTTAATITGAMGLPVVVEEDLREFDLGAWEGRSYRDLRDIDNLWDRWAADPDFAPPLGESPRSFNVRAMGVLERLADRHSGQTVLVVSHGALICNVLASWLGDGPQDWRNWETHNCSVSIVTAADSGWQPVIVNDIRHLPPDTIIVRDRDE